MADHIVSFIAHSNSDPFYVDYVAQFPCDGCNHIRPGQAVNRSVYTLEYVAQEPCNGPVYTIQHNGAILRTYCGDCYRYVADNQTEIACPYESCQMCGT